MGVVNVTPDSFSDGGLYFESAAAIAHGRALIAEGADIVDIGGESTRPGAVPVDEAEERRRVLPVVEALADEATISIDTRRPGVARAAVAAGARIVNDISASLFEVAADTGTTWVAMHMRGDPSTMQTAPAYDDVVGQVEAFLADRLEVARRAGIAEVWIDPGLGFGKTGAHNLLLLRNLDRFVRLGVPVLVGASRKRTLGVITARSDAGIAARRAGADHLDLLAPIEPAPVDDRLEASLATATWAIAAGAQVIRAHDVLPTVEAAMVVAGP
jgi:dihydropteroate synthase